MLKIATGAVASTFAEKLSKALQPWQFGAGGEGGAVLMAWDMNGAMRASPNDIFTIVATPSAL